MNDNLMILTMPLGEMETNCYILGNTETKEGYVFDPGAEPEAVLRILQQEGLNFSGIILTHGHFDHMLAVDKLIKEVGSHLPVYANIEEKEVFQNENYNLCSMVGQTSYFIPNHFLKDGDVLKICGTKVQCFHTPGHTCGGMCFYIEEKDWLIAGDTLFQGSIGRTDFPTGDFKVLSKSIKEKIYTLPDKTIVFPGHGPSTTVGDEKHYNMFVHL
ncbi:MAG: MBL fold metallo-hydrolase [Lachnospiraceae bacterium]|nr:MBL fold metallo-hydrolase [Lachnospiraceae bacterium]